MNNIAKQLLNKCYNVIPISKCNKMPTVPYKHSYTMEHARALINKEAFNNNDIAIALDRKMCCIDIDDDGITPSKTVYERMCDKIPSIKEAPTEKTKKGYHIYFSCNDEKLKRNIKILNSQFLNIPFDRQKYETLNDEQKKKVRYINDTYTLPVDFLIGFHNGTVGIVRTAPSTNIKTINELPYVTQLQPLPNEIKTQLELVSDKTLKILEKVRKGNYIPAKYSDQQIEKVRNFIQYLNTERFNNMKDFSKVTCCIHCISETLIDEWLELCKKSILWNEKTSNIWCRSFFNNVNFKSIGYGTFCNMLKQDNPKKYKEFIKEKDIINVDDIISKVQNVDINNYHDENGYLKELPADKNFLAIISPMSSGKTYQIKKLVEKHGTNKKILIVVGRCSLGCEFAFRTFKELGFQYYKDIDNFSNCNRLVIQVDSLYKLYTKGSDHLDNIFDWLIVDECELIADRLCQINKNKNECLFYFKWCLQHCKKVILSDGQLSQNAIDIFSSVRKGNTTLFDQNTNAKPYIIRNSFNKNTQIKHTVYHELRNNKSMPKRDFVVQKAIDDIKNGKKTVYCEQ